MNNDITEDQTKKNVFKDRPVTLIIAAVLLLLLIVVYAVFPLVGVQRTLGGEGAQGFNRGQFQQNFDQGNLPQGGQPFNQSNPNGSGTATRTFNANSGLVNVFRVLTNVLHWAVIALGVMAIVGLWLKKRWGIVWAIILSVIAFASTVPSLFRPMFGTFAVIQNIAIVLLSLGVIVLSLLPQTRKATAAV